MLNQENDVASFFFWVAPLRNVVITTTVVGHDF